MSDLRVQPIVGPVSVAVSREPKTRTPDQRARIDRAWSALVAANPGYFDGPILSFESYDPDAGVAYARVDGYAAHAVRGSVNLGLSYFGITGVLRVREPDARRYLLARRSPRVHEYPGQWEFGPCGGIDPPPPDRRTLTHNDLVDEIAREAREELGLDLCGAAIAPAAFVHDEPVGSTDLMMLVDLPARPAFDANWEYTRQMWLTLPEILAWDGSLGTVIPTTRSFARWLHDTGDHA